LRRFSCFAKSRGKAVGSSCLMGVIGVLAFSACQLPLPSAHKMDYLQLIAGFEVGVLPVGARNDFEVQLDRYTIGLHSQMIDQRCQSKTVRKFALFAVEEEKHTQASSC